MKTKVIHILGHSPAPAAYNADIPNLGSTNPSDSKYFIKINPFHPFYNDPPPPLYFIKV